MAVSKRNIFIHVIVMYFVFLLGEWTRMFAFHMNLTEPYDEMMSVLINISIVILFTWLYAVFVLKMPMKKFMICGPLPKFKWCVVAVLIPSAICLFYIFFLDGTLQKNILSHTDLVYIYSYTILRTGVLSGIVEEIIFRGMIMNILDGFFSRKWAIFISAFLFASIHLENMELSHITDTIMMLISITIAGIALSAVAYETGSIWSGVIIHGMYNIITSGQILEIATEHNFLTIWNYTPDTRNKLFTGGDYGITAGIPTVIGFLIIIVIAKKGLQEKNKTAIEKEQYVSAAKKNMQYIFCVILLIIVFCYGIVLKNHSLNMCVSDEIEETVQAFALNESDKDVIRKSRRYCAILKQRDAYPTRMIEDLERNPEMLDFVEQYGKQTKLLSEEFTQTEKETEFPLLIQWDSRWGYKPYGNSIIGLSGCGPTCLSMVLFALTRNPQLTPDFIAGYSMDKGYYIEGVGTSWDLMTDIAEYYGVTVENIEVLAEDEMKKYLSEGAVLICSMGPGDFTDQGHFIVIRGYNKNGFIVNDPFSYTNSSHEWSYEKLIPQICQTWIYTLE